MPDDIDVQDPLEEQETESTGEEQQTEQPTDVSDNQPDDSPDLFSMSDEEYMEFINKVGSKEQQEEKQPEAQPSDDKPEESEDKQEQKQQQPEDNQEEIDYKAFYENVMQPFKSNGKTVTPSNIADIRNLMQMGTDYTRKTQQLAPLRRIAETVRNAKISDEDLNNLINAYNGDKEALRRIFKKNNINPMDIDVESEDVNYRPNNNIATDKQIAFSEVLDEVQPSIPKIRTILNEKWDKRSAELIASDPKWLRGLHQEIEMDRFDVIQEVLENQRALGRFKDVSDIEAYSMIASAYVKYEQEKAEHKLKSEQQQPDNTGDKSKAAPVRKSPTQRQPKKISESDLAAMSDDEFMKFMGKI